MMTVQITRLGDEPNDTYPTKLSFCDGKYTVLFDLLNGVSECLRYGEEWRDLRGDKLILAMFDEVVELKQQLEAAERKAGADGKIYSHSDLKQF
jgi:hypothetical protein